MDTLKEVLFEAAYWIGVVLAIVCFALLIDAEHSCQSRWKAQGYFAKFDVMDGCVVMDDGGVWRKEQDMNVSIAEQERDFAVAAKKWSL